MVLKCLKCLAVWLHIFGLANAETTQFFLLILWVPFGPHA